MSDSVLEVKNITCDYAGLTAVSDLSFAVAPGALVCLLGPSGCGKTTVLRAIAGFHALQQGEIVLNGESVSRPGLRQTTGKTQAWHGVPRSRPIPSVKR